MTGLVEATVTTVVYDDWLRVLLRDGLRLHMLSPTLPVPPPLNTLSIGVPTGGR
jgi:hypothetical protein